MCNASFLVFNVNFDFLFRLGLRRYFVKGGCVDILKILQTMGTPSNLSPAFKFDISSFLPEGHEKAFKQAFYNLAATVFLLFFLGACVAVYYVLEPFLRPLLWAGLFGSVLHPFKHTMTVVLKSWLQNLQDSNTPLTVGAVTFPFLIIDHVSEQLLEFILHYAVMFISIICCIIIAFLLYSCVPELVTNMLWKTLNNLLIIVSSLLEFCHGATIFVSNFWNIYFNWVGYMCIFLLKEQHMLKHYNFLQCQCVFNFIY